MLSHFECASIITKKAQLSVGPTNAGFDGHLSHVYFCRLKHHRIELYYTVNVTK